VICYPNYQVAIANDGDRLEDVAGRVGISADELARYNGIEPGATLAANEVIALPRRVSEPPAGTNPSGIDITTLAGNAINRAGSTAPATAGSGNPANEPIRHKVEPGETAFSISRLYNVSVRALSEWNGLGPDLNVRSGQYLLIPVAAQNQPDTVDSSGPGEGSLTPRPPSASTALPADTTPDPVTTPASPNLGDARTDASGSAKLAMPASGKIIRSYVKKKNDGIDIAASAGARVVAAADGVVAAITRNTEQVPILVLKHAGNLLTVYAGVEKLTVKKGDKVKRGQKIAVIRAGDPSFLHFEVRQGLESVDPMEFLN